ncbi:MAG: DUF4020 domain-containing protein, partial [Acidimicrobiia bacterium]|nr:DUF4020 domain-containing protein [Acidimicrobiia bacterium]
LAGIFDPSGDGDYRAAFWFARTVAADLDAADAAMTLFLRRGGWFSASLWLEMAWVVEQGLEAGGDRARHAKQWIPHLAAHVPGRPLAWMGPGHQLAGMLDHLDPVGESAETLLLADWLLDPAPYKPGSMFMGLPVLRFADWVSWVRQWWKQKMLPGLADRHLAEQVISLLDGHLRSAHRIAAIGRGNPEDGARALSFEIEAIDPNDQDRQSSDGVGLLVDMARDALMALLAHHPDVGDAWLEAWSDSAAPLFRRLAVHGWAKRENAAPDMKVEWLARSGAIADHGQRREAMLLAEQALPDAGPDAIEALIAAISPPPAPGDETEGGLDVQATGDWLNLVARCARASPLAQEAFASFKLDNPSWQPGEHFGPSTRTRPTDQRTPERDAGDQNSIPTVDDLVGMIADDPRQVIEWVAGLPAAPDSLARPNPQREAESRIIEAARGRPAASVALLDQLVDRAAAGSGTPMEERLAEGLLQHLAKTPGDEVPCDAVLELLPGLWQAGSDNWREQDDSEHHRWDWASDALSHWAGIAARVAVKAGDCERASSEPPSAELSDRAIALLEQMIAGNRYPNHLAQTVLASLVCTLHEADRDWSVAHVLPLFNPDDAERARRCWNSYLRAGQVDQELLDDGMLDRYTAMCSRATALCPRARALAGGERHRFARHWARLAVHADLDPRERRISQLIADADLDMRLDWIEQVAHQLSDLPPQDADAQWDRWICDHWADRLRGAQKTLVDNEATMMANWLPYLDTRFPEAVDQACKRKTPITGANQLIISHLSGEGSNAGMAGAGRHLDAHPEEVGVLTAHMMRSTDIATSSISRRLSKLVARLLEVVDGGLADEIAEQAKRLDLQGLD